MMQAQQILGSWSLGGAARSLALALCFAGAAPGIALAGGDTLNIGGDAFTGAQGVVGVNATAGALNQQANGAVLAQSATSIAGNTVTQNLGFNDTATDVAGPKSATITGNAFADANGAVAVNGAAGAENQQANMFAIAFGIEGRTLAAEALSQTRASVKPPGNPDTDEGLKTADIGPQAFSEASGLVQVNLTAGERNSSANVFALSLMGVD